MKALLEKLKRLFKSPHRENQVDIELSRLKSEVAELRQECKYLRVLLYALEKKGFQISPIKVTEEHIAEVAKNLKSAEELKKEISELIRE